MTETAETSGANSPPSTLDPPTRLFPIIRCIGPGLIVAGSIVGSGELIATTKTGAEAGFSLLWLIILGCVVKVFAQIEFGRYAIVSGKTTLRALDEVPGPRIRGRGNWLVWYWVLMWIASISQLGGIVGGVGQSLAISLPLTNRGAEYNAIADAETLLQFQRYAPDDITVDVSAAEEQIATSKQAYRDRHQDAAPDHISAPNDAAIWAIVVALITSVVLWVGRYGLIQSLSTILVASFTLLTITNLFFLQDQPDFQVTLSEFFSGLKFHLPASGGEGASETARPIGTALATFGIIGVGAAELVVYPYWCLEKGYARFVGTDDGSPEWLQRASGWMKVMRVDAWGAMVVYTFATIIFYLLGAAILHRVGLNPEKDNMVRTLAVMFVPVFSEWASAVFLFGAFAVLYLLCCKREPRENIFGRNVRCGIDRRRSPNPRKMDPLAQRSVPVIVFIDLPGIPRARAIGITKWCGSRRDAAHVGGCGFVFSLPSLSSRTDAWNPVGHHAVAFRRRNVGHGSMDCR